MLSSRLQKARWLGFAFNLVPTAIIAAVVATLFELSFWQVLSFVVGFVLLSGLWKTLLSSLWFQTIGRRSSAAEFLESLREQHYPKPETRDVRYPYTYFAGVRDGSEHPVELRTDAAGVAAVISITDATGSAYLDRAWADA